MPKATSCRPQTGEDSQALGVSGTSQPLAQPPTGGPCSILAVLATTLVAVFAPAHSSKKHSIKHHFPCHSLRCKRAWGRLHHWHPPAPKVPLEESEASWYGPADSGGSLACTEEPLTSSTLGVANKTLPCGTRVKVCLDRSGPCVDVRVVDRGPYVEGRSYDLTEATARAIGFLSRGVGPVWVGVG